jgi:hypothetical protein
MKSLFLLACFVAAPALAAPGVMLKDDELRATASATAASAGHVAKGAAVEVLARQGGWTQVAAGELKGWVRILAVRVETTGTSGSGLAGLVEVTSKRDSSRVVATAGLRGLSEEELKSARFDASQLMNLDRYQVDRAAAEQYARAVGLVHRDLGYLPAPQREKAKDDGQKKSSPFGSDGGLL